MSAGALRPALDALCPMHLVLSETGHIVSVGPTLQKLFPGGDVVGGRFFEMFEIQRPRRINSISSLREAVGTKLHMRTRTRTRTELKAAIAKGAEPGTLIVNLAFGVSIVDAVRDFELTVADFAPTDLAVEMLYLIEAKSAAMEASYQLNRRLQSARRKAEQAAVTDVLTGLQNRRAIERSLKRLVRQRTEFALMNVDLDFFKEVNDQFGHAAGDSVLQNVARIMIEETRENDAVSRIGGDEFLIVVAGAMERAELLRVANRIIERVEQPVTFEGEDCRISASIGITQSNIYDRLDLDRLQLDGDIALYASKRSGRARVTFFSPDLRDGSEVDCQARAAGSEQA